MFPSGHWIALMTLSMLLLLFPEASGVSFGIWPLWIWRERKAVNSSHLVQKPVVKFSFQLLVFRLFVAPGHPGRMKLTNLEQTFHPSPHFLGRVINRANDSGFYYYVREHLTICLIASNMFLMVPLKKTLLVPYCNQSPERLPESCDQRPDPSSHCLTQV